MLMLLKNTLIFHQEKDCFTMVASGLLQYLREFAIGADMISKQKEE
jgi:protein involved in ribonucleotide reduction